MTSSARFRGPLFALLSLLVLSPGAQASLSPQTGAPAGRCTDDQVKDLFPEPAQPRPELRVLVTSFSGADQNAEVLGVNIGRRMRAVLETHARQEIKSDQTGLYADAIRVKFVPCTLDDHEHARKIGEGAQADVVLWGEAFCTAANPRSCQTTTININSGNVIQDSPGARIENKSGPVSVRVSDESPTGRFSTSLTVVRWHGLEGNAASGTQVKRFDQVAALGLPRLVSEQPRLLLDVVLGLYASRAGRHGLAAEFFERAKKDVAASVAGAASLYRLIGTSYLIAGRTEQGLSTLAAALQSCTEPRCEAKALNNLGWAKQRLGDQKTALSYYERALPLRQKVGDVSGEAITLNSIGLVYSAQGDKKTALSYYERALPLGQKVGDIWIEAITLNNIGLVYSALGDRKTALSYYDRALPLKQKVGDISVEATMLNNIGGVYSDLGDQKKALSYYERALPLRQKVGDVSGEATTLHNIGGVYSELGDKKTALSYFERALPLRQKVGDISGEARTHGNRAFVFRDLGRIPEAIQSFREASACYLRRSPPDLEQSIRSLTLALSLAMRAGKTQEVSELGSQLDTLDPDELRKLLRQARTEGQTKSSSATLLYQRIVAKASTLPAKPQARLLAISQAGLIREQHRSSWPECPGILITEVVPASQAESLGLRAGDIALRYQDSCLFEPSDWRTEAGKTKPDQPVTIELWRDGAAQILPAKGGKLDVALESF